MTLILTWIESLHQTRRGTRLSRGGVREFVRASADGAFARIAPSCCLHVIAVHDARPHQPRVLNAAQTITVLERDEDGWPPTPRHCPDDACRRVTEPAGAVGQRRVEGRRLEAWSSTPSTRKERLDSKGPEALKLGCAGSDW
jgi:hypothetical protein